MRGDFKSFISLLSYKSVGDGFSFGCNDSIVDIEDDKDVTFGEEARIELALNESKLNHSCPDVVVEHRHRDIESPYRLFLSQKQCVASRALGSSLDPTWNPLGM